MEVDFIMFCFKSVLKTELQGGGDTITTCYDGRKGRREESVSSRCATRERS